MRAAVVDAFAAGEEVPAGFVSGAAASSELAAHGRLGGAEVAAALRRALDEVVRPAAAALLGASALPGSAAVSSPSPSWPSSPPRRRAIRARRSAEKFTAHLDPEEHLPRCGEFC
ncbi:hypothetical protein [Sorangium sp. So ce693]|uniref:hypothetical protein n=1 Tax=Sorangium sp. So ce693 TaxID=3133318 RepID=UPI003F5D7703